jgi:hypothetical protein
MPSKTAPRLASKYLTENQLSDCYRAANRARISSEDLGRMLQSKSMEHLRPSVEAAGHYWAQVLMKKWGYTN